MSPILEAKAVNKKVELDKGHEFHILKDVDLEIEEGEFVSVMGPSGSGKSTLLYNISGMDRMTSGTVKLKGHDISHLKEEELAKIRLNHMGFIFQDINLLKNLSLIDNVMFPALIAKEADKKAIYQKAKKLLEMTGIEELADHQITQGSGGQLQRVAICRALMNKPEIIFGDEPTGSLDSKSTEEIMSMLSRLVKRNNDMIVTHDVKWQQKRKEYCLWLMERSSTKENEQIQ